MEPVTILVNSARKGIGAALQGALPRPGFEVVTAEPGESFLAAAGRAFPDIALVDFTDGRDSTAELEIDLLRAIRPDVRIIPIGRNAILHASDGPTDVLRWIREGETGRLATCA